MDYFEYIRANHQITNLLTLSKNFKEKITQTFGSLDETAKQFKSRNRFNKIESKNIENWGKHLGEILSHFEYQRATQDSEELVNKQGINSGDIEAKIQEFEVAHGQLDLVSTHARRIGQEFKKSIFS